MDEDNKKKSVALSVNKSLDDFFSELCKRVIEVDGKKVYFTKNKNDIYNRALEYAIEHINEWMPR